LRPNAATTKPKYKKKQCTLMAAVRGQIADYLRLSSLDHPDALGHRFSQLGPFWPFWRDDGSSHSAGRLALT
jgi:hypothetical protein